MTKQSKKKPALKSKPTITKANKKATAGKKSPVKKQSVVSKVTSKQDKGSTQQKKVLSRDATVEFWDGFAPRYTKVELNNFQGALTAFLMAGVEKPGQRILEVASGSGTHAEIISQSFLSREGSPVYVTCDFSG